MKPCKNQGQCIDAGINNFTCSCKAGFTEIDCGTPIPGDCRGAPEYQCPENADCSQLDGQCSCHPGFIGTFCDINLVALIALPFAVALSLCLYFILNKYYPAAKNQVVLSLALTLYDFTTDCLFAYSIRNDPSGLFMASLVFLALPVLFNLFILGTIFLTSVMYEPEMEKWLQENYTSAAAVAILSSTNIEMFALLQSRLFNKEYFNAPFSPKAIKILLVAGFIGSFLEDIPQLVIQSVAASTTLNTVTLLSIIASVLSILFGFFKKTLIFFVAKFGGISKSYMRQKDVEVVPEESMSAIYTTFEESDQREN